MSEQPDATTPWRQIHAPGMAKPIGYSNAILSRGGQRLTLAGQIDMGPDGEVVHPGDLTAQAAGAFANIARLLEEAGAKPEHLVRMRIFVLDIDDYKACAKDIGRAYRTHFGRWFPAMTLVQIVKLYDDGALIEVESEAIIPD